MPASLAAAIQGTLARVADALEPFETAKAGDVVQRGLKEKPRAAADAVNSALGRGYRKPQIQRNLNLG